MAAPATPTFRLNWLNIHYKKLDNVHNASIKASPILNRMRFEKAGGESVATPFTLNSYRGDSGNFQAAQAVANQADFRNSAKYRWNVPLGLHTGSVTVEFRDIVLSRTDQDAAARALQNETDQVFKQRASNIMRLWFGPLGSYIGSGTVANATVASGVVTFANRMDVADIFPGDVVSFSSADGTSGSVVGSPGYVVKVESEVASSATGRFSVSASSNGTVGNPAGVADGTYFVFKYGNFDASSPTSKITPLQAYIPATPATSDLHNVKRSQHTLLSGLRVPDVTMAGRTIGSKIKLFIASAMNLAGVDGSSIDTVVLNPLEWQEAEEEYSSTVSRNVVNKTSDGFSELIVNTPRGETRLVADPHCPQGVMFFLSMGELIFHSPTGTIAMWADQEGSIIRRKETELVYEMTPVSLIASTMRAPFAHGRQSTSV
jgi:hypothetical protein